MGAISGLGLSGFGGASGTNTISEVLQDLDGGLPVNAGVSDADTLAQAGGTLGGNLLVTLVDVGLNHNTDDGILALTELVRDLLGDQRLVAVVLVGVAVGAVDHDDLGLLLARQSLAGGLDALTVVVGALVASTEDDEAVLVTSGLGDSSQTLLGDTQEAVGVSSGTNGINGNSEVAVGTVLEANGETETGGELTVQLRLGGAGANSTERDQIGQVLRGDGIQHLTGNGHAHAGKIRVELTRDTETLVDVVGLINVGVVDQTLPPHRGAGLLKVGTHDDTKVGGKLLGELLQTAGIFEGRGRVVNRAGADNNQQTVILLLDNLHGLVTARADGLEGFLFLIMSSVSPNGLNRGIDDESNSECGRVKNPTNMTGKT